ncbi:hypothetical protein [Pseudomonas sp.]|uniref:hypothetical protein n=1 Tax=Pseudomonas sp. TaxID=306 RepID=UPI0028A6219C|nr:hypothetical protein [Pseudomonas sp.]
MPILILLTMITLTMAVLSLRNLPPDEAQQVALLPFADDPEAARQLTRETGLVCERVVQPAEEPEPPYRLVA